MTLYNINQTISFTRKAFIPTLNVSDTDFNPLLPVEIHDTKERLFYTKASLGSLVINGEAVNRFYTAGLVSLPTDLVSTDSIYSIPDEAIKAFSITGQQQVIEINLIDLPLPAYVCSKVIDKPKLGYVSMSLDNDIFTSFLKIDSLPQKIYLKLPLGLEQSVGIRRDIALSAVVIL